MQITVDIRARVWDRSGGVCAYCGVALHPLLTFTVDHVKAVSKGGTDDIENLVAACRPCNSRKHARDVDVFRNSQPATKSQCETPRLVTGWVVDGGKVKQARRDAALSLRDLEARSGVAFLTIHRIETRKVKDAFPSTLRKLADALGVQPADLMSEWPDRKRPATPPADATGEEGR